MLFSSHTFLFLFLPVTLMGFFLLGTRGLRELAMAWLVLCSLFFYGWWNPAYLILLAVSVIVNFSVGRILASIQGGTARRRFVLTCGIIFNLGLLGYFKYANFFVSSVAAVTDLELTLAPVVLPLAISFFTFQQIAYLVDAYQGKTEEHNFMHYMLFVTFFPQLIAGPIVHHKEMLPQFVVKNTFSPKAENFAVGLTIFFIGLFKKVILADGIAPYANAVFGGAYAGNEVGFLDAWSGAFAFSFQVYFDFSGYSDMAIGLARMFGINLPLNFNSPFKSRSMLDLWQRWHMTLARFLRDYLFFPLIRLRKSTGGHAVNLMIATLLGGLWHGAGWGFVIWGGLNGLYLIFNRLWQEWHGYRRPDTVWSRTASTALTFVMFAVAAVFFRAESLSSAWAIIVAMFSVETLFDPEMLTGSFTLGREMMLWFAGVSFIVWGLPNTQQFMQRYKPALNIPRADIRPVHFQFLQWQPTISWAVTIGGCALISVLFMSSINEFVYFQF